MPKPIKSHYDNLKVSRSAPPEVIAAAYRALSKQLHPDKNPDDPNAAAYMRLVNIAYGVLSDPAKRAVHDEWIIQQEKKTIRTVEPNISSTSKPSTSRTARTIPSHWARFSWVYLLAGSIFIIYLVGFGEPKPSGLPEYIANPSPDLADAPGETVTVPVQAAAFVRPALAPNGSDWPTRPAYVTGYPLSRADGLSTVTIDNSTNSSDMFVKLVALDADKSVPIRHAYIPAGTAFSMNKIRSGEYDVRYMDLTDGSLSRSESFQLEEIKEADGVRYSVTTMTLYKVANGNMQTYPLAESEF